MGHSGRRIFRVTPDSLEQPPNPPLPAAGNIIVMWDAGDGTGATQTQLCPLELTASRQPAERERGPANNSTRGSRDNMREVGGECLASLGSQGGPDKRVHGLRHGGCLGTSSWGRKRQVQRPWGQMSCWLPHSLAQGASEQHPPEAKAVLVCMGQAPERTQGAPRSEGDGGQGWAVQRMRG